MRPRSSGFTLLELLIAIALLSLVLVALISSATYRLKLHSYIEQRSAAVALSDSIVQELKLRSETNLQGNAAMGLWQFSWQLEQSDIPELAIRENTLRVFAGQDEEISSVVWLDIR